MDFTIDQVAELFRPDDPYQVIRDATYTSFSGLKVQYESDDYIPTQAELEAVDYSSLTTIDLWHRYGESVGKDFLSVRYAIIARVIAAGGFTGLSSDEKSIAAEYFAVGRDDRLTIFGTQEAMEEAGLEYHARSKQARLDRYNKSIIHVYNMVPQPAANAIATDFYKTGVSTLYIESGVKGTLWGDPDLEGMLDYINATPGTNYEPNGIRTGDTAPESGTLDELCDDIIDIITLDILF